MDVDYMICNFGEGKGKWFLVEEKCRMAEPNGSQREMIAKLESSINDPLYKGYYLIQFENTSPDDGKIFIAIFRGEEISRKIEISKKDFLDFLEFKKFA